VRVVFKSDRRFEFERFKRFELSGKMKLIFIIPVLGVFAFWYNCYLISKYGFCISTAFWIFYACYFTVIYPIILIYQSTKPKTYEITSTGIRINGQLIRWKNFKRIRAEGDFVVLERHIGIPIVLPKIFKEDLEKVWRSERDSLITHQ